MARLNRRALVAQLVSQRGDAAIITGLGSATYDCFAAGDSPSTSISGAEWAAPP